jgi:hypothetical protein
MCVFGGRNGFVVEPQWRRLVPCRVLGTGLIQRSARHFPFEVLAVDAALDDEIPLRTEQQQVFDVVAPNQYQAMAGPDWSAFQHLQPTATIRPQCAAEAEASEKPGENGDEAKNQQQRQDEPQVGIILHAHARVVMRPWKVGMESLPSAGWGGILARHRAIGKLRAQAPVGLL